MAQKTKQLPALGSVPKARAGKCGPGMGTMPGSVDNTLMNPAKPAGGKAHKSMGGGERKTIYPNAPPASKFTSLDGKLGKVAEKW
jgi:hypothetical protein